MWIATPGRCASVAAVKLPIGQRLGTYSVSGFLGEGGTSEVYLVCKGAQSFALKILKEEHRTSEALQARLINEAITLQKLDIAGVVRVFDEGDFAGRPFYVMEYLPTSLSARLIGLLPPSEIVPVITSLLRTLSELHQRGYVHRDVKPSNILFAADGTVRIADFGHAKLPEEESCVIPHSTETGAFLGTREYAAPEQLLNAKTVDGRADVYALGLILYEALAGRRPFMKQKPAELARLRLTQRAPRLSAARANLSPQLVELVAQMLERTPERRPCADQLLTRFETVPLALTARFSAIRLAALLALPVFLSGPSLVDSSAAISVTTPSPILLAPSHAPDALIPTINDWFQQFNTALDEDSLDQVTVILQRVNGLAASQERSAKLMQKEADLARERGEPTKAMRLYLEAKMQFGPLKIRRDWAACAIREADMLMHLGKPEAAYSLYAEALRNHSVVLARPEPSRGNEVHLALFHLGLYYAQQKLFGDARKHFIEAIDATPPSDTLFLARTEERLASLPTQTAPIQLLRSAAARARGVLAKLPHSRRAQLTLLRSEYRLAHLEHDVAAMQSVFNGLDALWSEDKRRGILAHDYLELLMEGIELDPQQKAWKLKARALIADIEQRKQWQGDIHLNKWKKKLGA